MNIYPRPVIIVSRCLGFDLCRYNGQTLPDPFVEKLKSFVEFKTVCPEVEIGLGVPRPPIRIISIDDQLRLIQPETGRDLTETMDVFSRDFLQTAGRVDGFILKSRSPSCGIKDVRIHPPGEKKGALTNKGSGFFGRAAIKAFPWLAIEDEGRLNNFNIREHFLTRIYTQARFRETADKNKISALVEFHSRHKFLLMAYAQSGMRALGRIAANHEDRPTAQVLADYEQVLGGCFGRLARYTSNINVLMHAFGYFSEKLSSQERNFFFASLEKYRSRQAPLRCLNSLLKSWIIRFDDRYLKEQVFFEPYPEELISLTDSGKGRI